jgi:hypothetical protein
MLGDGAIAAPAALDSNKAKEEHAVGRRGFAEVLMA